MSLSGGAVTRRTRPIYRVFVSSTWLDLQPERRSLMEALNRMEEMRFVGMEFFGNRPDDTHDASIDQVNLCEVFVGIIGHRYGSGITEAEYRRARELNLPCFVYFKRSTDVAPELTDNDPALAAKLAAFKQDLLRGHTVKEFASADELAASATADLHNWVAARWISLEPTAPARPARPPADADRTNVLRLLDRIDQDWIKGVLEASLHHRAWLELGLDWREDAVEHPWDRIVVAANRPIQTLRKGDSIADVFDAAQHTLLVLGEPGAGKTTTILELARDLIARARDSAAEPVPVVLALSTWRGQHKDFSDWLVAEMGLRYQVPKRVARGWLEEGRLVLILDGLDEVVADRRAACVDAINAFEQAHPPPGLAVTCRVVEYNALTAKLRLRSAICLQPLTPAQVDRYFQAAGPGLDPLRLALREDAGLRDLARSPLMLSVMTMAWRDAPAGTTAPFATAQTPEELRHRLFDAYVQAMLRRRGKSSGGYTPDQTLGWLTWLARRMKEHGHTLFATEQLQPGWLDGTWRQFAYFAGSRLLGTLGLVLPFLVMADSVKLACLLAGLAGVSGSYIGVVDFAIARDGWGGHRRGLLRFVLLVVGIVCLGVGWLGLCPTGVEGIGALYMAMVGVAFCAPVDVRTLDIKPAGSIQWSSQQAAARGAAGLGFITVVAALFGFAAAATEVGERGLARGWQSLGGWAYVAGLLSGAILVAIDWRRRRLSASLENGAMAAAFILLGGQIGGSIAAIQQPDVFWRWEAFLGEMWPVLLVAVFGGFGSTLIDPARPQRSGVWFWLRVPVLAFLAVGGIIFVPGLLGGVLGLFLGGSGRGPLQFIALSALVAAGCGLVAFLRFGGFNGAQHFLLRWLFSRSGHLPRDPEAFLAHASQLALLQKVGLGYRFVHALLLQHLASSGGAGSKETETETGKRGRPTAARIAWLRTPAWLGLGAGLMLLVSLGVAGLALGGVSHNVLDGLVRGRPVDALPALLGVLTASVALTIPVVLLAGRRLGQLSWPWLAGSWIGLGLVALWLAWDEPVAAVPTGLMEAPTASPAAAKSYEVLARYSVNLAASRRILNLRPLRQPFKWTGLNFSQRPEQGPIWGNFISTHRAEIETNWSRLEPVRAWIAELNAFNRLADLDADLLDPSFVSNQVRIPYAQNATAIACLQALDGQGDAALATLQPLLEVGAKLEEGARGSGFHTFGRELQAAAIRGAAFVLDHAPVSPARRAEFATALATRGGGPDGARHLYRLRYAVMAQASASFGRAITAWNAIGFDSLRPVFELAGSVAYNRQAALNRWAGLYGDLQQCAAQRDPEGARRRVSAFLAEEGRPRLKNVGAAWITWLAINHLSLTQVDAQLKAYWTMEDQRGALLARLRSS